MEESSIAGERVLEELGFTPAEVKIYLALLELGPSAAGAIIKRTGLQNSVVHLVLGKMAEKGIVSYTLKGKHKVYLPSDPNHLQKFVDEREERLTKVREHLKTALPVFIAMQKSHKPQEAEVYTGFNGFKSMLYSLIADAKQGDEYLFMNYHVQNPERYAMIYEFYTAFAKEREKRGIIVKGIAPLNAKRFFAKRDTSNIIFTDIPIPANITIFHDCVVIEPPWKTGMIAILIHSEELAESYRKYWKYVWDENARKGKPSAQPISGERIVKAF